MVGGVAPLWSERKTPHFDFNLFLSALKTLMESESLRPFTVSPGVDNVGQTQPAGKLLERCMEGGGH